MSDRLFLLTLLLRFEQYVRVKWFCAFWIKRQCAVDSHINDAAHKVACCYSSYQVVRALKLMCHLCCLDVHPFINAKNSDKC